MQNDVCHGQNIFGNHFRVIENDFKEKKFYKNFLQEKFFAARGLLVSRFDESAPPPGVSVMDDQFQRIWIL